MHLSIRGDSLTAPRRRSLRKRKPRVDTFANLRIDYGVIVENQIVLREFAKRHNQAAKPLTRWLAVAEAQNWKTYEQVKATLPATDMIKPNRLIFDIKGNDYRLLVKAYFAAGKLVVESVHTHAEYSKLRL